MKKSIGVLFIIGGAFLLPVGTMLAPRFGLGNRYFFPILIVVAIFLMITGAILSVVFQDKFSEKRMNAIDHQSPCPVCKKDVFKWGKSPSSVIRMSVVTWHPVWVRICANCGNVQHFTDMTK